MKDFDLTEIRAARSMSEANYMFDRNKGIATRQEIRGKIGERVKRFIDRIVMKEGRL